MKKVLAMVLAVCMIVACFPAISFAADATITAATTAFFTSSSTLSTVEGSDESGSSCVLVAWNHSDNWNAASSFTDTDGVVTSQTVTSGTGFGSSRNAVVSFDIPSDFDAENVAKVTLGLTVRYVKQINQAGARLAIYGNSVDGTWTTSSDKSIFGVSGTNSGLSTLPLLGLTSPISSAGNNQVDQEVTLSSKKLAEYVAQMANEGKTQVTFRIAVPYGGVWIYNSTSSYPATLKIEEGTISSVNVKTVYMDGEEVVKSESTTVPNLVAGSTYEYTDAIAASATVNDVIYVHSKEDSTLSVTVAEDGSSEIVIVYNKYDESQTFSGYELDDEGAWCWFADPRSITYTNEEGTLDFSIIGYIDIHGDIKATQINHMTDEVNEVLIRSNIQPDDHNNPTFLVLPDERIIVFYSRHTDERCFWYRVTEEPGDLTTLGEEKCLLTSAATTYPSPFLMGNDPDHIYLMWRGIDWHPTIAKLSIPDEDGNTEFTYGPYQMVKSTGARPYAKYGSNGVDKLYVTYTTGHPDNENPNWLYFNQIDIETMTLEDINGNTMSTISSGVLNVNRENYSQTNLVDTDNHDWVWQTTIAEDGHPVIAMVRLRNNRADHDYYYVKWNGTEWVKTYLAYGGGHFHQTAGRETCYSGGMAIDPDNTNIIYCSVPVEGAFGKVYEIIKYTMSDDGTQVLETEQITKNSQKNNVRPFVLPNSEGKDVRLIWMNGDYYYWIVSSNYDGMGYCTRVMTEAPIPTEAVNFEDAVVSEDYASIGGAFVSTTETANIVEAEVGGEFTVSADIYLEGDYEGTILDMGDTEVRIETRNTPYGVTRDGDLYVLETDRARVVVNVNGTDYVTSNVYGSSDCWKTYGEGTGGNYGVENYQGYVNHTITYDGEYLTLYREGLVDIKIPCEGLSVENVTIGSFDGLADNVAVFDRVLNHDEIKALAEVDPEVETPDAEGDVVVTKTYVEIDGTIIDVVEEVLPAGTEVYNFKPEEEYTTEDAAYALDSWSGEGNQYTVVYYKTTAYGENLISSLDDVLVRASDGGALAWATVDAKTVNPNAEEGDEYIHFTGEATGGHGANTMRAFIPVEGGKKYLVSNTIYNNTSSTMTWGAMSAVIATGEAIYGTHSGLTMYSHVNYGGTNSWSNEAAPTFVGDKIARFDYYYPVGEHKAEFIIEAPEDAKNIMISYGAWGNTEYYYGDFVVREVNDVETVTVTVDGKDVKTYGTIELGEDGSLPENVIGYYVTSADDTTKLVNAGEISVSDGDVITTAEMNVSIVTGAQVRYGGGVDEDGKISSGNGLRFIAQIDRSNVGDEVTYGMVITAEDSDKSVDIPAVNFQDDSDTIFTAAITDLAVSNYNRSFTATPYANVTYADGTTAKIYAKDSITRSIYQVAVGLLKAENSDEVDGGVIDYAAESHGLYDVLNAYVNMVGIRLTLSADGTFAARSEGSGAYTGDIFFDVISEVKSEGVYTVTVTPVASFNQKVTIMKYWDEFVRINNNHTQVAANITNSVINEDGSVTFDFTVPTAE